MCDSESTLETAQRRLTKNPFRTFVHPAARMEELIRSAGFERSTRRQTWMWSVDVYNDGESSPWNAARTEL